MNPSRAPAAFSVIEPPEGTETALVVEVPHAAVFVDTASLSDMIAPVRCIGRDADLLVDMVFEGAPATGATLLVANYSRYVIDLNRAATDYDGVAVEGGLVNNLPRGLIWRTSTEGGIRFLARRLGQGELTRRLDVFYRPYHAMLASLLERKRAEFGRAVLLCAHSMPSQGRRGHVDVGVGRADVVPGTRGRSTASADVIDAVDSIARARGFSVKHDDPYKGGFSTGHYGKPAENVDAIQVELARRLYLDEERLAPLHEGIERTRALADALCRGLGALSTKASRA